MVSPYMSNPFAGLQQGLQTQQALRNSYFQPQQQMLKTDALREQLATSQQQRKTADIKLEGAQQQQRMNQAILRGGMAKMILQAPEEQWPALFREYEQMTGQEIPPDQRTREAMERAASIEKMVTNLKMQGQKGTIVESALAKDKDGKLWTLATYSNGRTRQIPMTGKAGDKPEGLQLVQKGTGMTAQERMDYAGELLDMELKKKEIAEIRKDFNEASRKAQLSKQNIAPLVRLLQKFETGGLAAAKQAMSGIFPWLKDANAEAFLAIANQFVLGQKDAVLGGGVLSEGDVALLKSIGPQIGNTPEGNLFILQLATEAADQQIENAKLYREWVKQGNDPLEFVIPSAFKDRKEEIQNKIEELQGIASQGQQQPQQVQPVGAKSSEIFTIDGVEVEVE